MKTRELMSFPVYTCLPDDSLESAARQLWEHDCGILPVVDRDGRVRAAITDRDICMSAYTRGGQLANLRVADSMSSGVVTCRPDDDITLAASRMAEHQLHRLPVVDEDGKLCGLLSLNDLALAGAGDSRIGREALKVLTAACRRRSAVPATRAVPIAPIAAPSMASAAGRS